MSTHWKCLTLFVGVLGLVGVGVSYASPAEKPIWANGASALDVGCLHGSRLIPSPDHRSSVSVLCHREGDGDPTYSIQINDSTRQLYEAPLREGAHELLWAPNSLAFFIDGGTSGYAGFFVTMYRLTPSGVQKETITDKAQKDMVATFPPCKAANADKGACARLSENPEYNMSGVGWTNDSTSIFVFAEVPCSSSYGGIMCQVRGYELGASDGRIRASFTASQVKERWGDLMAWPMHVPDPPVYANPEPSRR